MSEVTQSTPLAAWDERRCREFVRKCFRQFEDWSTPATEQSIIDELTAELASMPGGRVDGEVVEAAKRILSCTEFNIWPNDDEDIRIVAKFVAQSTPLAAWDERRRREFVERVHSSGQEDGYHGRNANQKEINDFAAELASMPGGRVDGEVVEAAKRILSCTEFNIWPNDDEDIRIVAKFVAQSTPLAAWDERRCREFVERVHSSGQEDGYHGRNPKQKEKNDFAAELASMPGGRVDGEVVEAAKRILSCTEFNIWPNDDEDIRIVAKFVAQSTPLAAWDERRRREFVERVHSSGQEDGYHGRNANQKEINDFAAELASMPGGRVDYPQEVIEAAKRHAARPGDKPCGCDAPACIMARHILSGRGADDSGEAVTEEWLGGDHATCEGNGNKVYIYVGYTSGGDDEGNGRWCACINDSPFAHSVRVPTRGDVRRLLDCLGIVASGKGA